MDVEFHKSFEKSLKKQTKNVQNSFARTFRIFLQDPFHYSLNNHALKGNYLGRRSINVTGDVRAIYKIKTNYIIFMEIGTHAQLYK